MVQIHNVEDVMWNILYSYQKLQEIGNVKEHAKKNYKIIFVNLVYSLMIVTDVYIV